MEARLTREGLSAHQRAAAVPVPEDFGEEEGRSGGDAAEVFSDLIGCKQVLDKLREWQATIKASQNLGRDPLESFELNFLFVGAPGEISILLVRAVCGLCHRCWPAAASGPSPF